MEIDSNNFCDAHDILESALRRCEFFSVDLEFTGIDKDTPDTALVGADGQSGGDGVDDGETGGGASDNVDDQAAVTCQTLLRTPGEHYASKKSVVDRFTATQIGISTFERVAVPSSVTETFAEQGEHQASPTAEARAALSATAQYMLETAKTVLQVFQDVKNVSSPVAQADPAAATTQPVLDIVMDDYCLATELAEDVSCTSAETAVAPLVKALEKSFTALTQRMQSLQEEMPTQTVAVSPSGQKNNSVLSAQAQRMRSQPLVTTLRVAECLSQVIALYSQWLREVPLVFNAAVVKYRDTALRQKGTGSVEAADGSLCAGHRAPAYEVRTFYAYLFPSEKSRAFAVTSFDAATLGEFLANNHFDADKWVQSGLRYTTLPEYAEHRLRTVQTAAERAASTGSPHRDLPDFTAVYADTLDDLFPLSREELAYVRFAVLLPADNTRSLVAKYTRQLFLFARENYGGGSCPSRSADGADVAGKMAPPPSAFIADKATNAEEGRLLRDLGIRKANRSFMLDVKGLPTSASNAVGKPKGGYTDVQGTTGTLGTTCAGLSIAPGEDRAYYGSKLLSTVLTACQVWRKPLVLHNGYSDVAFLIRTLFGRLPETYQEFKILARETFPVVYDTRTLSTAPAMHYLGNTQGRLQNTVKEVLQVAGSPPGVTTGLFAKESYAWSVGEGTQCSFLVPPEHNLLSKMASASPNSSASRGNGSSGENLQEHNAGYDAFITGQLFAMMKEEYYLHDSKHRANDAVFKVPYEGICPMYGSVFSVNFSNLERDCILQPENAPIVLVHGTGMFHFMEAMSEAARAIGNLNVSVRMLGSFYTVAVCTPQPDIESGMQKLRLAMESIKSQSSRYRWGSSIRMWPVPYECLLGCDAGKNAKEPHGTTGLVDRVPGP